jgi:hypothetical protein
MNKPVPVLCMKCRERSPLIGLDVCAPCIEYDRLLGESLTACPEILSYDEFVRFMKKLSVHAHATRPPGARQVSLEQMEESLTAAVLKALPLYFISVLENSPKDVKETGIRLHYTFKTKLPREILYQTVEKLKLWKPDEDNA